jgi:hypothetical protein
MADIASDHGDAPRHQPGVEVNIPGLGSVNVGMLYTSASIDPEWDRPRDLRPIIMSLMTNTITERRHLWSRQAPLAAVVVVVMLFRRMCAGAAQTTFRRFF